MIEDKVLAIFTHYLEKFCGDNIDLFDKLYDKKPLIYGIQMKDKLYIMVDHEAKLPSTMQEYQKEINASMQMATYYNIFPGYDMKST